MSSATLTSLAMLKVNIDQGRDYLDYLRPFILQVLYDHKSASVTDPIVCKHILNDFGLEIPERTVHIVLRRLSREHPLTREHGVYRITGDLPNPGIAAEKAKANRHIRAVVAGLKEFSKDTTRPVTSDEEAVQAICAFLAEFDIPCLRAYLRDTAIPTIEDHNNALIVLVSEYVVSLQETDPGRFDSFLVVVEGHMLSNALLCPDLRDAPKTYKGVTFYFDTPLLVRRLGLDGKAKQAAVKSLIALLHNLGARVAVFSHSRDELERVIQGASDRIDSPDGRGSIVMEARRAGTTKSDLLMIAGQVDDKLAAARIKTVRTPRYEKDFQIDEGAFEGALNDEVSYLNRRAKEDDINSVRSIYVLRSGETPRNLESTKAVLVTSNRGFATAAFKYGRDHEESQEVSPVITDFRLANMAWLKAPLGAPELPMKEVIAFSYAALQPSKGLLERYFGEIEKLGSQGTITAHAHQLLRSEPMSQRELMSLTLGEEAALTDQTVIATLTRVTNKIKKKENEKYRAEQASHRETQQKLAAERTKTQMVKKQLYWRCYRNATVCAWAASIIPGALIVAGLVAGIGLTTSSPIVRWAFVAGTGVLIFVTFFNLFFGTTMKGFHGWVHAKCLTWFLRRESASTGLALEEEQ